MNTALRARKLGILQILLSGFCFGFLGIFGKTAYARGLLPGEFLSLRFLLGAVFLFLALVVIRPRALALPARQWMTCLLLGLGGYAVFSSCYFMALQGLSASLTVLLLYTYPVVVAAGAWIFFGEKIARNRWLALPLVMFGLVLLIGTDLQVLDTRALLFGLASAVFYSLYILASSHWLKDIDPLVAVAYIQLAAGVALSLLHWRDTDRLFTMLQTNWLLLLATALICSVAAMSLFLAGLKKLRNWETSILSTAEPVTGILLAMIFLGESLGFMQMGGALLVLAAFVLVALP